MPRYTNRWGLSTLGPGDSLQADGFKFTDADRQLIDRLLAYAIEQHRHTGTSGTDLTPDAPLNLTVSETGGTIASGTRYYYQFTMIDELGNESAPSPTTYVDTATAVTAPGAPALSYVSGSGALEPGGYSYVLSAYRGATTQETKATSSGFINIPGAVANNEVSLILPTLPFGADGFNVYRKSPSGMHYLWLTSIASPDPLDVWVDDGSLSGDCDRSLPSLNRAGGTNSIAVSYPGATPYLPDGWAWRVYRTTDPTNWSRSYLKDMTPIGSPPTVPVWFTDTGLASELGGPPTQTQVINAPPKINLTDALEVFGYLPPGRIITPQMVTFVEPGLVVVAAGSFTWVCEYDQADVVSVRAYLGIDSVPASTPVMVDVVALRPSIGGSTYDSLFAPEQAVPTIAVGENATAVLTPERQHLERGDSLSIDVLQDGGGATPTDVDLTVNLLLYVTSGSATTSYTWSGV